MKKFLYAALSLLMLASCSDDPLKGSQNGLTVDDNTPGVYIGVNFRMPGTGGSRSTTDTPPEDDDNYTGETTSNGGTEVGQDYENNVNEVLLILARKSDYGFIGAAKVSEGIFKHTANNTDADEPGSGNIDTYHATAKFSKSQIEDYYDMDGFEKEIAVFVVVNPNGGLQNYFAKPSVKLGDTGWINEAWTVSASSGEGAIWSSANGGHFLMTNSRIAIRELPANKTDWERFSTNSSPFHLSEVNTQVNVDNSKDSNAGVRGAVNVQRACARFDFKDGSDAFKEKYAGCFENNAYPKNTYPALFYRDKDGMAVKEKPLIFVTMTRMSLVNMNNTFYYFERVSDNGLPSGANFGICKPEKPWYTNIDDKALFNPTGGNYVVDYYAKEKYEAMSTGALDGDHYDFDKYFEYPLFDNDMKINSTGLTSLERWGTSEISDILANGTSDNYGNKEYKIWRYVTENVIPYYAKEGGTNTTGIDYWQPHGLTTGIVFRARMIGNLNEIKQNPVTSEDIALNKVLYALNGLQEDGVTALTDDSWKNPFLYMYAQKIYATWQDLVQAAVEASLEFRMENGSVVADWNRTASLYMALFGDASSGLTIIYHKDDNGYKYNVYNPNDPDLPKKDVNGEKVPYENGEHFTENNGTVTKYVYIDDSNPVDADCANQRYIAWVNAGKPDNTNKETVAFKDAVTDAEITIYQSSVEDKQIGYYCYYYYWNRHNDNNRNGVMGPMEFCTVRNNVYKLCVTDVSRLGHPRLDENDPDTPKPGGPDESSDVYITVDSRVIPWVVRVNNIEF